MIKNIIREKWIMTVHSPLNIFLKIFFAIFILIGGELNCIITIGAIFLYQAASSHTQINYLIPISDEERKKQCIIKIFMISIEYIFLFIVGTIISVYLYDYGNFIKENKLFMVLWTILIFLNSAYHGLNIESDRLSGIVKERVEIQLKKDIFGNIVMITGNVLVSVIIFFLIDKSYFVGYNIDFFMTKIGISIVLIISALLVVGIIRKCRSISVGDYYEIF